jgi:hypothetical protein
MGLFLVGCSVPFAGDWAGSGVDSEGNTAEFVAKVIHLGGREYRVLILDALDTPNEPMHVMYGVLTDGQFLYTADEGLYTGSGTLNGDTFTGYYKGPVDGTFIMYRIENTD